VKRNAPFTYRDTQESNPLPQIQPLQQPENIKPILYDSPPIHSSYVPITSTFSFFFFLFIVSF